MKSDGDQFHSETPRDSYAAPAPKFTLPKAWILQPLSSEHIELLHHVQSPFIDAFRILFQKTLPEFKSFVLRVHATNLDAQLGEQMIVGVFVLSSPHSKLAELLALEPAAVRAKALADIPVTPSPAEIANIQKEVGNHLLKWLFDIARSEGIL